MRLPCPSEFSHSLGQKRKYSPRVDVFRCSPNNGHRQDTSACPFRANFGSERTHSVTSSARASSEGEAERQGVIVRVAKLPMDSVLGAQATDQRQGFMKALVGDSGDRILGFTMIGAAAGEVMAAVQTAMLAGLSYSTLADADFAHPTMAEGLSSLFSSVPPRVVQQTKSKVA